MITIIICLICLFLAQTLLLEQKQAAQAYAQFVLHYYTVVGIIIWSLTYIMRMKSTHELNFWLTLPLNRFKILMIFIVAFSLIAIFMTAINSFWLKLFCSADIKQVKTFFITVTFECLFNIICIVMFSVLTEGVAQVPIIIILLNVTAYTLPLLTASLNGGWLAASTFFDHFIINFIQIITTIFPYFTMSLNAKSLWQTTGFTLLLSILCYHEFRQKRY